MGITAYSVIVSVVFYNVSLIAVFFLRRSGAIRAKYAAPLLLFLTLLGALRLVIPIDLDAALVLRSYSVLPALKNWLGKPVFSELSWGGLLLLIWAAGIVVVVVKDLLVQRRFQRSLKTYDFVERVQLRDIVEEFGDNVHYLVSPQVRMPYVTGLIHPVIYLPDIDLSNDEWRMVFRHEIQHIHSHDGFKKLFFLAVEALFWWNPLAHISEREINTLIELRCDEKVSEKMDPMTQLTYYETLKTVLMRSSEHGAPVGAASFIGGPTEMKLRFQALLAKETRWSRYARRILPCLMVIVFLASYFVIIQPAYAPPKEDIQVKTEDIGAYEITQDLKDYNDYILFVDNEYRLYMNGSFVGILEEDSLSYPPFQDIPIIGGK